MVHRMYFEEGYSKREIQRRTTCSWKFILRWTQSKDQDLTEDRRGWTKGNRRKWDGMIEEHIREIRTRLEEDPDQYYFGPTAVQVEYRREYPGEEVPPLRTIGQILTDLGLTKTSAEGRREGAAEYLCYPEHTIYETLGERVLEADFVGDKYIQGRSEPLNFLGYSFKQEPRLRHYERIESNTADCFIESTGRFFERFEVPDVAKVDNAAAMIGSPSGKRNISRVMEFLLEHQVNPVFSVPRRPFTQASIEGSNSVFSRKFWNQETFGSVDHMEERLEVFNASSRRYLGYAAPGDEGDSEDSDSFEMKVYFARQVREDETSGTGTINVLNESVEFPKAYIQYFVLAEWDLSEEKLLIRFEQDETSQVIHQRDFPINEQSKKRCSELLST